MDTILVVNAGSSSVKFQVFGADGKGALDRVVKGQMDGIGTRPRLRAQAGDKSLIDRSYAPEQVSDVAAALKTAGAWLRETHNLEPVAVGHRVAHGGPDYGRPVLIDAKVLTDLERYVSLAPLHQPNNLAPVRAILASTPGLPQVACFDTSFHRGHSAIVDHYAIPEHLYVAGVRRYDSTAFPMSTSRAASRMWRRISRRDASSSLISAAALPCARCQVVAASKARWALRHWTACRWARGPVRSIRAWCSTSSRKSE
jgi:acetate kinase